MLICISFVIKIVIERDFKPLQFGALVNYTKCAKVHTLLKCGKNI